MAIPKHLDEAAARLKQAAARIDAARVKPLTLESVQAWLGALTDYAVALSDTHAFNNESIHEQLHELGGRVGVKGLSPLGTRGGRERSAKRNRQA